MRMENLLERTRTGGLTEDDKKLIRTQEKDYQVWDPMEEIAKHE
jgi:hypothetical protein